MISVKSGGNNLRRGIILVLVSICFLSYKGEALFAEDSAIFEAIAPLPAVVEAGRKMAFVVRITNTGTETW